MANDRHGARDEVDEQDPTKPYGEQVKQHECHRQCQHQSHNQQHLKYCLFHHLHKVRRWRPLGRVVDVANFLLKMNSTDRQKEKDNAANITIIRL